MNRFNKLSSVLSKLQKRLGGSYIFIALLAAQLSAIPLGILIAFQVISTNTNLTTAQINSFALISGTLLLLRSLSLFAYIFFSNKTAFVRLDQWAKGVKLEIGTEGERDAWRQITSLAWRYIFLSVGILIFIIIPIALAYLYFVLGSTSTDLIYVLIALIVVGLSMAILEVLLAENLLAGTRLILIPAGFENQVTGIAGVRMLQKFQIVFFIIIFVTILLIAPIGYHQTTRVLYEEIGSQKVLTDIQLQSLFVSAFSLFLGFGLSFLLSRSFSQSFKEMINTFGRVESGDLEGRLSVTATDEMGELEVHFNRMLSKLEEAQSNLEGQVASRTAQLQATIEVGHAASSILKPDELIPRVVNLISDRFGYYYAAIFLVDDSGRWAVLADATGEAGKSLKTQGHRLEIGGKSMVGTAIATRQAKIALDVGLEPIRFENPLLPNTRSEIALPLVIGDRAIGALDVQSIEEAAFHIEDIDTLQGMSNQVAIALENARLFQETQRSLDELRSTNRQYISEAWAERGGERGRYEYISSKETASPGDMINVPITLRDQSIGELRLEGDQEWTEEERSMIEAVATQAALALENARLLEESQEVALRERLTAEIIGRVWASPNTDAILKTAVKELGRALRADEATIEIRPD